LTTSAIKETGPSYGPKPDLDIPERLLSQLWQRRAAKQATFRSPDGLRVRVLYFGHTAGPDFRDVLLEVEGVGLVQGDVEIHVRRSPTATETIPDTTAWFSTRPWMFSLPALNCKAGRTRR